MNNKPVAWMQTLLDGHTGEVKHTLEFIRVGINDIPLYTHPVKELKNIVVASATCSCGKVMEVTNLQPVKELTDEEIRTIHEQTDGNLNMIDFARAILRKAQEK